MKYTDPPLNIGEQLALLQHNNLTIDNVDTVRGVLTSVGYFRLNNYMKYFKKDNKFRNGTIIKDIQGLYEFDKVLRINLFDAIADIEVAIKALINNTLACKYGSHWLEIAEIFKPGFSYYHQSLLTEITEYCKNNPDEHFIKKYKQTYSDPVLPPSWMIMEVLSFGKVSMVYDGILNTDDRVSVSAYLKTHDNILSSWLHSFTYVRNLCAHHAKILDRNLTIKPTMPARKKNRFLLDVDELDVSKIYSVLCCIQYLLLTLKSNSGFKENIINLVSGNPVIKADALGFTSNWTQESIWK
ncbi:Abi family protein [Paraflavitalea soli]|uniref:Abi family protein n=1 Tax=Paraflavitalea soli TaxID=2315862 RepID=A0A3B7MSI7_9BACT|nr:Abi family protein [Paraflavitalea soli]AXY75936.1 Abi family protein [Paraflavitalea soli]